ncbi:3-hydroxyacyl-CoA dehydrogenase [Punctularia strigosozonata HHB-11173 SS5]|uniref:3-hydroxyacyl-CoA dehydrogenase n=1 Tax=Punctularia strigosozonata (strain HHB-11173) TaxID=741275 RepID=UPI0004416A8C|nr:3-hydroxyacyl-CoA dehydrogenase [Punctularia strigosozonata HHB-11173 SS5]EIN05571.1 3-hydroxyacyl-CoA dehydrogenase [Punctularia strigosozonata HHB-11173 SS5]
MRISRRTFVISGGSSGLGLATAQNLLEAGAYISVLDLNPPPEQLHIQSGSSCQEYNARVKYFETDITSLSDIERAVAGTVQWFKDSGAPLGGVINCAGVGLPSKILDYKKEPHPLDRWEFVMAVNLTGSFNLTRLCLPHLASVEPELPTEETRDTSSADGERGVVVFASSAAAYEGQPGQTSYSASKGALVSMTLPMARDLADYGIRVVAIAPSMFESPMTDKMKPKVRESLRKELVFPKRFGRPQDFAQTVRWIIECAYINGETIRLNGGTRMPYKL